MTTVYIVRHAYAQGNLDRSFQGRIDGKLTELGYQQLDCLANYYKGTELDSIYTSPLSRAYETAEAVNRFHDFTIYKEDGLLEIAGGDWEGKKWAELEKSDPVRYEMWTKRDPEFQAPNGEKLSHVYDRMVHTVLQIVEKNKDKTICIVSHGCAILTLMAWANGFPPKRIHEMSICDNTAVNKLMFDDDLNPSIIWQNDTSHLDDELKTYAASLFQHKG